MRTSITLFTVAFLCACDNQSPPGSGGAGGTGKAAEKAGEKGLSSTYPGTDEGARELLNDIRSANVPAMTRALQPTSADYQAVFAGDAAAKAEKGYQELWKDPKTLIGAAPANTELTISKATTEDLQKWNAAAEAFPGGYKQAAASFKPGLTVYSWKYTKPGQTTGMAHDGLIHVNGHWIWVPKPWRVLGG